MAHVFERFRSAPDADSQRARRTELLLSQLYQEETNERSLLPRVRGLRIMGITSVLAFLVFTGTLFYKFNAFIVLREDVMAKQGNLESAVQRRSNLFGNLIKLTLSHAALEHSIFSHAARMRNESIKQTEAPTVPGSDTPAETAATAGTGVAATATGAGGDPAAMANGLISDEWKKILKPLAAEGSAAGSMGRLLAVVEQYPNIQSSQTFGQLMTSLVEIENVIAGRRVEYNTSSREYNVAISKFPWNTLANMTHFERIAYYEAGEPGTSAPLITPEIYQQLVPLGRLEEGIE